ncbi:MAG: LPP20 family lipoprotein [Betaproteobacteria bacterium]|nr:LPP20 family lipoprotein [Betaproteobacteria bacterium]
MTLKRILSVAVTATALILGGPPVRRLRCGGGRSGQFTPSNEFDGAPCWVTKSGHCIDKEGEKAKFVYGVGSVAGTRNTGLARDAALGRARTDIARSLQTRVAAMLKDYQATTTGARDFGKAAADEQHIVDVAKQITDLNVSGTEMVDSWISKTGTFWALARLDVDGFKDTVRRMSELDEAVREAVVQRADKAFSELDWELDANRSK